MFRSVKEEAEGIFTPRNGISINPFANYGKPYTKHEKLAPSRHFKAVNRT